jgi:hypothetical protein
MGNKTIVYRTLQTKTLNIVLGIQLGCWTKGSLGGILKQ